MRSTMSRYNPFSTQVCGILKAYVDGELKEQKIYTQPKLDRAGSGWDLQDCKALTERVFGKEADFHAFVPIMH